MAKTSPQAQGISFDEIIGLYRSQVRGGKPVSTEALERAFPAWASEIREKLPLIVAAENNGALNKLPHVGDEMTVIGGCRIGRELGRGAMGAVYEAEQIDIGRKVAIKIIPRECTEGKVLERFAVEAQALGRIDHPNVVPVYSFGSDDQYAYLVMRQIEGASIAELLNGVGPLEVQYRMTELRSDWDVFARFATHITSALRHVHQRGLVHRDIKPANILLDKQGKVWITDFGLAKIYEQSLSLSITGDAIGTPRYMAPEQLRGMCDVRSDIYSLGLTLYEVAAGKQVWDGQSLMSMLTDRTNLSLPDISGVCDSIPDNLAKIIMKCCEMEPDRRYQTADELMIVLQRFLAKKPISDRRSPNRMTDEEYGSYRTRRMFLVSGVLMSVCLFCLAWSSIRQKSPEETLPETVAMVIPTTPVSLPAVSLIDQLADAEQENMLNIVTEYMEESIEEASEKLQYSDSAKQKLRDQVTKFTGRIRDDGGVSKDALNTFLREYRETTLPTSTRIMRLTLLVGKSGMKATEKRTGIDILRRLSTAVANEAISVKEAEIMMQFLLGRDSVPTEELEHHMVSDLELRGWLARVHSRLSQLPPEAFDLSRALQDQLGHAFDEALRDQDNWKEPKQ